MPFVSGNCERKNQPSPWVARKGERKVLSFQKYEVIYIFLKFEECYNSAVITSTKPFPVGLYTGLFLNALNTVLEKGRPKKGE